MARIAVFFVFLSLLLWSPAAQAGFGITPPYVQNDNLTRSSQYQQKIILVRGDPSEDLKVTVTINVPGIGDWFSIDKGTEFTLAKGQQQVPMVVTVKVPKDARFGTYKGNLRIVVSSLNGPTAGTVGISLGAQVDVNLSIVDRKIFDFKVRGVGVSDLEEGHSLWWMFFPGKIRFTMKIENTGNVPSAPARVEFDIYDAGRKTILERTVSTNDPKQIEPFQIGDVVAELPTRLPAGSYQAKYRIYKQNEVIEENELHLSILPYGTLIGYAGYGFSGLYLRDQIAVIGGGLAIIGIVGYGGYRLQRKKRKS